MKGRVIIVGAGPGDPGLITVRGMEAMRNADVIVHDRRVNPDLLAFARNDCEIIDAGKTAGKEGMEQGRLNRLLVELASGGRRVVRLKGGDPFVFGRGGEEAEHLAACGIDFEVVPGITSAIAAPAYAGIPLTHRRYSSSFTCVTGHEDPTKQSQSIDWKKIGSTADTLVILMGMGNLVGIIESLLESGMDANTPAAIIEEGTTPLQRTVSGSLADLPDMAAGAGIQPPAVIVVGRVVSLRERISWFDDSPLKGKTVLVTRPAETAGPMARLLSGAGAVPLLVPVIAVEGISDRRDIDAEIRRLQSYDWAIFTSVNGVRFFFERMQELGVGAEGFEKTLIGAIGPKTATELGSRGVNVDVIPEEYWNKGLVEELTGHSPAGKSILIPRALDANSGLVGSLESMGARVCDLPVYRTRETGFDAERVMSLLRGGGVHAVTFMSPSAVRAFFNGTGDDCIDLLSGGAATVACIGPVTAAEVRRFGPVPDVIATESTAEALVAELGEHYVNVSGETGGEHSNES